MFSVKEKISVIEKIVKNSTRTIKLLYQVNIQVKQISSSHSVFIVLQLKLISVSCGNSRRMQTVKFSYFFRSHLFTFHSFVHLLLPTIKLNRDNQPISLVYKMMHVSPLAWFPLSQLRPRQRPISSQNKAIRVKNDCSTLKSLCFHVVVVAFAV